MTWRFGEYGWRLLPGGITALIFAVLLKLGALQPLEQAAYSTLFRLRGEVAWDDRLVVVAIDDASIKQVGRFPWPRQRYVDLLNVLSKVEPSVIAINLVLSEESSDDAKLAQAMTEHGGVVLAQAHDRMGASLPPVPTLQNAAISSGHILYQGDADGITRKVDLQVQDEFMLGLSVIKTYALVREPVPLPDTKQLLWINWPGRVQKIQQYSFVDVVAGKIPAQIFRDKIVLVGVTATGLDPLSTPFDRNPPASGVHLHAAVINNLLQQNGLHLIGWGWSVPILLLLGGPGLSLLLSCWREEQQLLLWSSGCLGWSVLSLLMFKLGYWLPVALPLFLATSTAISLALMARLRINRLLQQQVQWLWQQHQQDLVVHTQGNSEPIAHRLQGEFGSTQSVTQLAILAEQFARSQSTQAAIARSLSIGLLAADLDGQIWFCNPVICDWLKVQVGSNLRHCLVPEWLSADLWQSDLQTLKQQMPVLPREFRRGDFWFEMKLEPLTSQINSPDAKLGKQHPVGLLVVLEEITTRKQVEATLQNQVQELQRLSYLKDDFLSTVSHELRAPMANIKMAITMLKLTESRQESTRYIEILQNECNRETDLINDLLDLQRLEAGVQKYTPKEIDLQNWLPPIVQPFHERAEAHQQTLQVKLASQLPCLVSDQPSLERIMVELVNNACKYTPPNGAITVSAKWSPPHVQLMVSNSGSQIPDAELPRIFEKFYRVPQSDPWKRGGTGLGLALVKKLVTCLGGDIQVQSGAGGTTFTVQLPLTYEMPEESEQ